MANVKSETALSCPAPTFANELAATGGECQTTDISAKPMALSIQFGDGFADPDQRRPRGIQGNHESTKKSKRPGKLSGPLIDGIQSS
jgi:hypothetical protein